MRQKFTSFLLITGFLALFSTAPAIASVEVGQNAPPLVTKKLDGTDFDLSQLKDKVVIVHFWATWCASCKEEMPVLDAYYRKHHGEGLQIIAISSDTARHRDDVEAEMKKYTFPAALLSDVETSGFGRPNAIPLTYIVDKNGITRGILSPEKATLSDKILDTVVQPILQHP